MRQRLRILDANLNRAREGLRVLEALVNLGEFLGGIVVVVTLLYLAAQIRQNSRSLKASAGQSILQAASEPISRRPAA